MTNRIGKLLDDDDAAYAVDDHSPDVDDAGTDVERAAASVIVTAATLMTLCPVCSREGLRAIGVHDGYAHQWCALCGSHVKTLPDGRYIFQVPAEWEAADLAAAAIGEGMRRR